MAIKNKNLMMSLTESLNENKMNEIKRFKDLKEATVNNIDEGSSVESYESKIRDAFDDKNEVYNLQFNGNDETQFNAKSYDELLELWIDFCKEEKIDPNCLDNVEFGVEECDKQINEEGSDGNYKPIRYADFDFEEGSLTDKNFGDDYEDAVYEGYWIDIYYKDTHIGRVFRETSDGWVMYIELDYDGVDKAFEGIVPDIRGSRDEKFKTDSSYRSVKSFLNTLISDMGAELDFDAPASDDLDESDNSQEEPNEDDRKNILIAKKDELESRLGEILQSIKDKQMDTDEFRKLSREAADLDSEIMDLDNQIHGVYESVNEAELFNMDEYKDLADEDDSVNIKELKMIQDYAVRKTKEIINYVYYNAPYSGIGDNILNDMLNVIKESLPDMNESINESDEDVKKGIVDQLISTGMTKEQAEQTANDICHIFKNKVGSNQVVNEDINPDGFSNDENLQQYFKDLKNLPDEVEIDNVKYKMEQYGGSGDNCYAIYTDINNNDSYIKVFYSLNKIENGSYKGISKINGVSDLRESAKPIKEAAITEKNLLKSQGNIYMFECKGNSDFSHIVGENYNEEENTLENVETYNNKEDADKDYLGRCEITTESQKPRDIEDGLDESDGNTYKVKSYHVENMGGGTMAIFGQLEDGRYFAGNEDGLNLYDIDVWPYYEKDTSEEEFQQLEKDHNIGSIDSIDNKFEYEKIISQTNF